MIPNLVTELTGRMWGRQALSDSSLFTLGKGRMMALS